MARVAKAHRISRGEQIQTRQDRGARMEAWKSELTLEEQSAVEKVEGLGVQDICRVLQAEIIERKRDPLISWKDRGAMLRYARKLAMEKGRPGLIATIERTMLQHDQAIYSQFVELSKYLEPSRANSEHIHLHEGGDGELPDRLRELPELLRELTALVGESRAGGVDTGKSQDPDEAGGVSPVPIELDAEVPVPEDSREVDAAEGPEVLPPEGEAAGGQHVDPGPDVREVLPIPPS